MSSRACEGSRPRRCHPELARDLGHTQRSLVVPPRDDTSALRSLVVPSRDDTSAQRSLVVPPRDDTLALRSLVVPPGGDTASCHSPRPVLVNSARSGTPARANASAPPSSRSTTHSACSTSAPAARRDATAASAAPPVVTTSSTSARRSPGSSVPSICFAVPYSLGASVRTMTLGRPVWSATAVTSGTAPRTGPARRCVSGGSSAASAAAMRRSRSGRVVNRYLSM
jgi:hypothetical protein